MQLADGLELATDGGALEVIVPLEGWIKVRDAGGTIGWIARKVLAAASGAHRGLFVSSGAVYGAQPPEVMHIPETYLGGPDWLKPLAAYGEGKRAAELMTMLHAHQTGTECVIARCFPSSDRICRSITTANPSFSHSRLTIPPAI